jgi:hypothetical protein
VKGESHSGYSWQCQDEVHEAWIEAGCLSDRGEQYQVNLSLPPLVYITVSTFHFPEYRDPNDLICTSSFANC